MAFLFDIVIVVITLVCIILCRKRGLVRSLIEATGGMIAAFFAYLFAKPVGRYLADAFVKRIFRGRVAEELVRMTGGALQGDALASVEKVDLTKILREAPDSFCRLLDSFNVDLEQVRSAADAEQTVAARADAVVEKITASFATTVSVCICFLIFFFLLLIAVFLVAKLAGGISYIPVVGKLNRFFGAAFGVLKAIVMVCVFTAMLNLLIPYLAEPMGLDREDPYADTLLTKPICEINPLVSLLPTDFSKDG